ncbi:FAD-binding protein [Nocardia sp. SYP-A9097]|uniref:D-arabinono-1,4-lactone oxidase n=1 Tax=Nocardia sp. SYP-A9097 TaxID=2663237 RepID=UPI00129BB3E0|nr:D-arabinono-1,4-lactone oxidase [Nocardia sp. SYP-A9097]MRH91218.1 FAD-binding protein [Nocardia sp. SYP-A9097]
MTTSGTWRNWGRNQFCQPHTIAKPNSPEEVAAEVAAAVRAGRNVRAAGSGHSIMPIVSTDGLLIDLSGLTGVTSIDRDTGRALIRAGTPLSQLGAPLWEAGLSLSNQGDIDVQTISGATITGTKGSGVELTNLAAAITKIQLVNGEGELVVVSGGDELAAAQVSLGLLGVLTQLEIQLRPRYFLRERNAAFHLHDLLDRWDELKAGYRHFSFWWMPNERAHALYGFDPVPADHGWVKLLEEVEIDDSYDVRHLPEGRIGRSYLVYPDTSTDPTFHELEYMVDAARDKEAFLALRDLMLTRYPDVDSPIQIRWQKRDSAWLSAQYERDSVSVSVSGVIGTNYLPFFGEVEALMKSLGARPHWGKWNAYTREDMAAAYPRWADFQQLRKRFDPQDAFTNTYFRGLLQP